ncbi:putative DCC family thiol-disulfide oxidoreductase YuxK [Thermocatellispora tengchongensis]|uniref:Putative DCC family thiol-disulfide oxidoreductase YuxK n=1 Tax=Thermocatellispora tengchongensis TaxID=1073253 RepID=A0A840PAE7_9ACTN|nr:DUF393 domain-containing protein [Thermocatellispora tengchongensis]MBB5134380.1 putative DCC family thiol-disulfide oxidoreductase YuxK [Thermocatellispora tengchongensis]
MTPLLVYDGDCGFCTRCVRFAERRVHTRARAIPWQAADLDALGVTRERAEHEVLWLAGGRVLGGALAVAELLVDAGPPWRALGRVIRSRPVRPLAAAVYRLVARNRHRMPGGTPACALPPAERPAAKGRD